MLRIDTLQLLPTGRADLDEFLCSLQLSVVCVEHRFRGGVLRSRLRELRAVHLRESLAATNAIAELRRDANDSTANERRDHDLAVRIRLDHTGKTQVISARDGRHFADLNSGSLDCIRRQCDHDV